MRPILARIASILATFLLTIVVARTLEPSDSGSFFLAFTTLAVLATFARFGTDNLALKLTTDPRIDIVRQVRRLYGICVVVGSVASAAPAMLILFAGISPFNVSEKVALAAASAVIPQSLAVLSGAVLRGTNHLSIGTFAELGSLPGLTLIMLGAVTANGSASLDSGLITLTIASWFTAAWSVPVALRAARDATVQSPTRPQALGEFVRSAVGPLASMMGTSLLFYLLTWAPQYVLAVTTGPDDVALFTVAARLAGFIALVPAVQISYLAPAFARMFQREEITTLNALARRSVWQAVLVTSAPSLALSLGAPLWLRLLYGRDYVDASLPLIVLVCSGFLVLCFGQVSQLMLLCGLESTALSLNAGVLCGWATAGLLAAASWGVDGASVFALISSVAYAAVSARLLWTRRGIRSGIAWLGRPRAADTE